MITAEKAKEFQARSVQKRQENVQKLKEAVQLHEVVARNGIKIAGEPFQIDTLVRVRKQIAMIQDAIEKAITRGDSKVLKELTDSATRLGVWERELAGRPLPGSRRPREDRKPQRQTVEPMSDLEPLPQPQRVDDPNEPNG